MEAKTRHFSPPPGHGLDVGRPPRPQRRWQTGVVGGLLSGGDQGPGLQGGEGPGPGGEVCPTPSCPACPSFLQLLHYVTGDTQVVLVAGASQGTLPLPLLLGLLATSLPLC